MSSVDLHHLLVSIDNLSDEQALEKGRQLYTTIYTGSQQRGSLKTWKEEWVYFFADRYDHAFKTSPNRAQQAYLKTKVDRERIARIRWIKEILEGRVQNAECRHVPNESKKWEPPKYIILAWDYSYIIWLNGLRNGALRFSSAYPTTKEDMRRYIQVSRLAWKL